MRFALIAFVLLGCGHGAGRDTSAPDDLDLDESPFEKREPKVTEQETEVAPPDAAPAAREKVDVQVVSDPGEPAARIDLAVRDADVRNVLRMIATAANIGIVVSDDVEGTLTLEVDNVTWRQAIDVIAHLEGLVVTEADGVVLVKKQP